MSETEAKAEPEANTSAKVDALALAAKQDIEENGVSDAKRDEAVTFIVEHYPDFYADNETMEQAISYGYWLEYAYQNDEAARDYAELGMDLEQAVKYVYRGAESVEDDATQENLSQIRSRSKLSVRLLNNRKNARQDSPAGLLVVRVFPAIIPFFLRFLPARLPVSLRLQSAALPWWRSCSLRSPPSLPLW